MNESPLANNVVIGGVKTLGAAFLAPMHEVSDQSFRGICMGLGCGLAYSEMVNAKALIQGRENTIAPLQNAAKPASLQLFGSDVGDFSRAASMAEAAGRFDILDINMGCPAPRIFNNGDGSALLREPRLIERIVSAMVRACGLPVTVKLRRGVAMGEELAVEAAKAAESGGASAIAVHPRYRDQYYKGRADWSVIADVKNSVAVPVIGNGDISCGKDALAMMEQTGCDAVMIGRAALGNPWIFAEVSAYVQGLCFQPPSINERMKVAVEHARLAVAQKGESKGIREMRNHFAWYSKGMRGGSKLRAKACQLNSLAELEELAAAIAEYGEEKHNTTSAHHGHLAVMP